MRDLKVRTAWVHFPVGATFWNFLVPRDSVESTEFKANHGKTQLTHIKLVFVTEGLSSSRQRS